MTQQIANPRRTTSGHRRAAMTMECSHLPQPTFRVLAVVALCSTSIAVVSGQPQFKASAELVRITATVTADDSRQIAALSREDFVITERGRAQEITLFSAERQAMSVIFLMDVSSSMKGDAYQHARSAIQTFVRDHFGPTDEALVCVFHTDTSCANRWSRDADALVSALAPIAPQGRTRLLDAVARASEMFTNAQHQKRILIILSDGNDVDSVRSPRAVGAIIRASDLLIYAIAFPSSDTDYFVIPHGRMPSEALVNLPTLRSLTNVTGGSTLPVDAASRIPDAVQRIANELGRQYLLGYVMPPGREGYRELTVRVKRSNVQVRARRGYLAPAAQR